MQSRTEKRKVGITVGDAAGIGPEVIMKTFADERIYKHFTPVVFGNPRVFSYYKKVLDIEKFQYSTVKNFQNLSNNQLNVYPAWEEEFAITPGQPSEETGKYALKSLQSACEALKQKNIDVLVTAPINKKFIHSEQFPFAGHTEFLMKYFEAKENLMFMVSEALKVGLVTTHIPVKEISGNLSKEKIQRKIQLMHNSLQQDFGIEKPRIAVLGLNPHAGDAGVIGKEDADVIWPAVRAAKDENILAFGPYPADGFFASGNYKKFDGILAMYHDQGLIPFKFIAGEDGINYTAGLNVIRTSPDHGTAEDIAGKNIADPASFRNAIFQAVDIFHTRFDIKEMRANPLMKLATFEEDR